MAELDDGFPRWLEATMRSRQLSQAQLARDLGVAETQVSRWRRGLAVPTVQSLHRLAETFAVSRTALEQLAGYPSSLDYAGDNGRSRDAEREAERQAYQAALGVLLEERVPRALWPVFVAGCNALAEGLERSYAETLRQAEQELVRPPGTQPATQTGEQLGFKTPDRPHPSH